MQMKSTTTINATIADAAKALPRELTVDAVTLHLDGPQTIGKGRTFPATWTRGRRSGDARIELVQLSKRRTELTVILEAPAGVVGKVTWSTEALGNLALRFARALRYEIDTRTAEGTSAFVARRTSGVLVKSRIA